MRLLVARSTSSASSVIAGKVVSGHLCTSSFVRPIVRVCSLPWQTMCHPMPSINWILRSSLHWHPLQSFALFTCRYEGPLLLVLLPASRSYHPCTYACYASPFHLSLCALFTVLLSTVALWNCWLRLILAVISFQARLLILKHQKALYSYWNGASRKGINRGRF